MYVCMYVDMYRRSVWMVVVVVDGGGKVGQHGGEGRFLKCGAMRLAQVAWPGNCWRQGGEAWPRQGTER